MTVLSNGGRHARLFALVHQQARAEAVDARLHVQPLNAGDALSLLSRARASFRPQRLDAGDARLAGAGKQMFSGPFSETENGARLAAKAGGHHKLFGTVRP